jgi:uncharacterized protein YndB with AHSA1/START domain
MTSSVVVALRVKASPERAFDVFVREIGAWWRPSITFQTTPRAPGRLAFEEREGGRLTETLENGKVFEIGRIAVWDPPRRFVFGWRQAAFPPDLVTEVEVTFEPIGDETRVSVDHRGFHRVPQDSVARHAMPDAILLRHLAGYWRGHLDSFSAAMTRNVLPD